MPYVQKACFVNNAVDDLLNKSHACFCYISNKICLILYFISYFILYFVLYWSVKVINKTSGFAVVQKLIPLSLFYTKTTYLFFIASPGWAGNCLFLRAWGWEIDREETKKTTNSWGYALGDGNRWNWIMHNQDVTVYIQLMFCVINFCIQCKSLTYKNKFIWDSAIWMKKLFKCFDDFVAPEYCDCFVCVIAWAREQLRINFTRIFKVFTKLPESRSDEGNLENFLKIQVKLILNCPTTHCDYMFITWREKLCTK